MRAVGFYEYGNADVLQVLDLPAVNAGEGEVRVRVHAAAINPTDILSRSGARKRPMGKTDTYANIKAGCSSREGWPKSWERMV